MLGGGRNRGSGLRLPIFGTLLCKGGGGGAKAELYFVSDCPKMKTALATKLLLVRNALGKLRQLAP